MSANRDPRAIDQLRETFRSLRDVLATVEVDALDADGLVQTDRAVRALVRRQATHRAALLVQIRRERRDSFASWSDWHSTASALS